LIIDTTQIVCCGICEGVEFDKIKSRPTKFNNGGMVLLECHKCHNIKNVSALAEDVKHETYHMYDEPDDKPERDIF